MGRFALFVSLTWLAGSALAASADDGRLLRLPDICREAVTFVQAGDIHVVAASGGTALRLTSHAGEELYPKFSPDCSQIAFSAEYDGTRQVYVIPASGGTPRQLTWYNDVGPQPPRGGTDYRVLGWDAGGDNVLVRANRGPTDDRAGRPYLVPVAGGMEQPLAVPEIGGGTFSPDGRQLVYTPIDREFRTWKRHRGGRAQDVWTYDLSANTSRQLTSDRSTNNQPMWVGDTIYFTSDRNYTLNLFAMAPDGSNLRQVTHFDDFDVLWPSADSATVVFENGGAIWHFDPATQQSRRIPITVTGDFPEALPSWKKVAAQVESHDLDAAGKTVVFGARGEIFRMDVDDKRIVNLSHTPTAREIDVTLSPDGKRIAFLSDASGEYEIYEMAVDGGEARRVSSDGDIWRFAPVWSPDARHIAYADKKQRLRIVDVASGRTRDVDSSRHNDIEEYVWSPDGQWLAYSRVNETNLSQVWLYSLRDGTRTAVTEPVSSAYSPAFDPQGRWLYFLSNRDYQLTFSAYEHNYLYTDATRIYAVTLSVDGPVLYRDDISVDPEHNASAQLRVDPQGMIGREQVLKAAAGNYRNLQARADAIYFGAGSGGRGGGALELHRLALDADKHAVVVKGVQAFDVSADGKKVLARQGDKFALLPTDADQDFAKHALDLADLRLFIDPRAEWQQMYTDAWRILRDWFYDPGMHGGMQRWQQIHDRYQPLVARAASRADLDYILGELAGELNAGHVYVHRGDQPALPREAGGLLGAEFDTDVSGWFRITRIYPGHNWDEQQRSPLTEQGLDINAGDYILAINGVDTRSVKNIYELLRGQGNRKVTLRVNRRARLEGSREVTVKTLTSELNLRYLDWVASRRALVDELSGGRIGYIHLPNTAVEGNRELFKGMLAYAHKDALIIDDRYNGGGFIPDRMIELLAREPLQYWKRRGLDPQATPLLSHNGPKAMLINGQSSSGGDALPYYFRKLGLGKLIGTRTWGGLIGISGNPSLADGGLVLAATFRFLDTDNQWDVENVGVSPDIEVIDRPEAIAAGRDPSIEKAVQVLLDELRAKPPHKPQAPPAPHDFGQPQPAGNPR